MNNNVICSSSDSIATVPLVYNALHNPPPPGVPYRCVLGVTPENITDYMLTHGGAPHLVRSNPLNPRWWLPKGGHRVQGIRALERTPFLRSHPSAQPPRPHHTLHVIQRCVVNYNILYGLHLPLGVSDTTTINYNIL
jgi:hypothetical protein